MASRKRSEVRRFAAVALQRFEDAEILLANGRTNGAMYMAGYAIECILKALLLASVPVSRHANVLESFRGRIGHSFEALKQQLQRKGVSIPVNIARQLASVNTWSTELRYLPGRQSWQDANALLIVAGEVIQWAKGRF